MKIYLSIILTAILTNNYILSKFLGICPFLGVSKKLNTAVGMSLAVIFVMVISSAVTYPLNTFLDNHGLGYLQTIVFILVIAALVQLIEITLKKYLPSLTIVTFSIPSGNHHLQSDTKPKPKHVDRQIINPRNGRCSQFHLANVT